MRESAGCAPARWTIIGEPQAAPIPFRRSRKDRIDTYAEHRTARHRSSCLIDGGGSHGRRWWEAAKIDPIEIG
jgi:hypothetical protein